MSLVDVSRKRWGGGLEVCKHTCAAARTRQGTSGPCGACEVSALVHCAQMAPYFVTPREVESLSERLHHCQWTISKTGFVRRILDPGLRRSLGRLR